MVSSAPELDTGELSVVVPCFNEQQTVVELLRELRSTLPDSEIIIVDDASTDHSLRLINEQKTQLDLRVIALGENGGKGTAVRAALAAASRRWVVIQDADLEYDPSDLLRVLAAAKADSLPAVYGSRYLGRGRAAGGALLNFWGVKLLAMLSFGLFGKWLSDPHTCYKLIERKLFLQLDLQSRGFELCAEINSKLLRHGVPIVELPIGYQPRGHAAGKKIGLSDFFHSAWTYVKCRLANAEPLAATGDASCAGEAACRHVAVNNKHSTAWPYRWYRLALLSVQAVLLMIISWNTGPGWDEWAHLPSGLYNIQYGSYVPYGVNPPLARMWGALPVWMAGGGIVDTPISVEPGARPEWFLSHVYNEQHGAKVFWWMSLARTAMIPVAMLGTLLIWTIGQRLYGCRAAALAATLWVFSPTVLTFAASIAPDVTATVFGLLAAWRLYIWLRLGTSWTALLLGVAAALAMLSKASWLLLPPIMVLISLVYAFRMRTRWHWSPRLKQTLLVAGTCWVLIHSAYEFQGTLQPLGEFEFVSQSLVGELDKPSFPVGVGNRFRGTWLAQIPAPLPADYLRGVDIQKRDFEAEMNSYFLGQWRDEGWLQYYVVGIFLKEPIALWGIAIASWSGLWWGVAGNANGKIRTSRRVRQWIVFAPGFAVLVFVSLQTGFNHHLRYVLPFLPCLYLLVAAPLSRLSRPVAAVCMVMAGWYAASSLTVMPRTYAYFTEAIGGPEQGWKYIGDSNLDWGQDLLTAKRWIDAHPDKRPVYMLYDARTDFRSLEIDAVDGRGFVDKRGPRKPGWWIVTTHPLLRKENRWFLEHAPTEKLSVTTSIFHIPSSLSEQAAEKH